MKEQIIKDITEKVMVKLESQKIELGRYADVKTQIDKAEKGYKKVLDYTNKVYHLKKEAIKNTDTHFLYAIVDELKSDKKDFISKVEALGIDATKIPQPKEYDAAIKRISLLADKSKSMINGFK